VVLAHAAKFQAALDQGQILAPATSILAMRQVLFNDRIDAALCAAFMLVVVVLALYSLAAIRGAVAAQGPTAIETPFVPLASTPR
jgi:hypothetical protein